MNINRFGQYKVHSTINSLIEKLLLSMSSDSSDYHLLNLSLIKDQPNLLSSLISIHEWHLTIHKNYFKAAFILICQQILSYYIHSLLTIVCEVTDFINVYFEFCLKNKKNRCGFKGSSLVHRGAANPCLFIQNISTVLDRV